MNSLETARLDAEEERIIPYEVKEAVASNE